MMFVNRTGKTTRSNSEAQTTCTLYISLLMLLLIMINKVMEHVYDVLCTGMAMKNGAIPRPHQYK